MIEFEWDELKNISNKKKHGIWFEEVVSAFDDTHGRLFVDNESTTEDRYILIGYNHNQKLLVIVHCYRNLDSTIRIISARKATKNERLYYEKRI